MTVIYPAPSDTQKRATYFTAAALMIPLGLLARASRADADSTTVKGFVTTYLGDTLWAVMFFFIFAGCLLRWRTRSLAAFTLGVTLAIELSQCYTGEPLQTLRSFAPTRFLLGTSFLWSDVVCLLTGTAMASLLHYSWAVETRASPTDDTQQ